MVSKFPPVAVWNNSAGAALWVLIFGSGAIVQPEKFLEYAAECLRIAQETKDSGQKARLLEMAQAWQRLAQAVSKRENDGRWFRASRIMPDLSARSLCEELYVWEGNHMALLEPSFINQVQRCLPPCSQCGSITMLARIEPAPQPGHDIRTFTCTVCRNGDTVEVAVR
jgi:hypothetical protein